MNDQESGSKLHALQTLRAAPDSPTLAKRLECVRLAGALAAVIFLAPSGALTSPLQASQPEPAAHATTRDWPMFRGGPELLGVSPATVPDEPDLHWTFKAERAIKSSPAIAAGRVYIGSDDGRVYALEQATGKKIWDFKTEGAIESSPLVLEGRVFIGSEDSFLYALDAATGKLLWKHETEDKILGAPNWVRSPEGALRVVVGSYDFKLHCVDAATGKLAWEYESGNYINGSPAVSDGLTVFGGCDALLHVISLADGQKLKEIDAEAYIAGSAAVTGKRAYVGHYENEFLCVDLEGEGKILWRYKDRAFAYFSSPAITRDRVVFGGRDKRLHCLERETGKQVWTFATRGKVDSSPVIAGDKVIVGSDDGRLYIVSLTSGKELWSYEIGRSVTSSPAVVDGLIVIGSDDGNVYAFGRKADQKPKQLK